MNADPRWLQTLARGATALFLLSSALAFGCAGEEWTNPTDRHTRLAATVEQELTEQAVPGAAFAVLEKEQLTNVAAFGVDRVDGARRIGPDTLFSIGGMTASLTAIGLMRLVDEGRVDLDERVTAYIPELEFTRHPERLEALTVRHLLEGTSGLPDVPVAWSWGDISDEVLEEYLTSEEFGTTYSLMFRPGTASYPSTLAYDLAGLIIERISGRPYADFMREEVFVPLGMMTATFRKAQVKQTGDFAIGTMDGVASVDPLRAMPPWQWPSSGAFASARDLARLARFLIRGNTSLMSMSMHARLVSPQVSFGVERDKVQLSFGAMVANGLLDSQGVRPYALETLRLGGTLYGQTAQMVVVPERRFALIVLANRDQAWFDGSALEALEALLDEPVVGLDQVPESGAALERYVGVYDLDTGMPGGWHGAQTLEVTLELGQLYMTFDNRMKYTLESIEPGSFRCPSMGADSTYTGSTITFMGDSEQVDQVRAGCFGLFGVRSLDE